MIRRFAVLAALGAAALGLAGCGDDDAAAPSGADASTAAEAPFNDADISFAQNTIPHHAQAVDMAALAPDRTENAAVLDLAERIQAAQDPEIELMRGWLQDWGHDEMPAEMDGMDHDMSGMMSDDDMTALESATGDDFDRLFTQMMIEHHQGAIDMAETALTDGTDPAVRDLAEAVIATQSAEIAEMQDLDLG